MEKKGQEKGRGREKKEEEIREGGEKGRGREKKREKMREGGEVTVSKV